MKTRRLLPCSRFHQRIAFVLALAGLFAITQADVYFVRPDGNDARLGTSWAEAKGTVTAAIEAAGKGDEIWVAQGTYAEHITLKPDVALYGGFTGSETARDQRDWTNHLSALWGVTHRVVVTITNAGPATRLDGFTVGGGNGIHGGGIRSVGSAPVIANNTIRNNLTDGAGAGLSIWGFLLLGGEDARFPVVTNNVIVENQALNDAGDGGGIAVVSSSPLIAWNVITRNTAARNGGGIACWRHSMPLIANNVIQANSASYDELTASLGGGGVFASATDLDGRPIDGAVSAPIVIHNLIAANGGRHGGGLAVIDSLLGAATVVNNTIVANNGAGIYWANTWPTNANNIVAFNSRGFERGLAGVSDADIQFNNVFGNRAWGIPADYHNTLDRTGTAGNLSAHPRFANPAIGDFHLQPESPCVDAGATALALIAWPDLDGQARVQGAAVDMGADESDGTTWNLPTPIVRVSPAGDDTDGLTWATAKQTVAGGIAVASVTGGEVWVARGTYTGPVRPPAFVSLYGGFAGHETDRDQRDSTRYPTLLDGGGVAPVVYYRNAGYRVSVLDGFIVQNGGIYTGGDPFHSDLTGRFGGRGGGIYCRVSGPVIAHNLIRSNSIGSPFNSFEAMGGGLYAYLSHVEIRDNTFTENEVLTRGDGNGGGLYLLESMANIEGNLFRQNHARDGAAIYGNRSELRVAQNLVQTNALYTNAPAVYMGSGDGALTFLAAPDLRVEGNLIQGNTAVFGAGLCLRSCYAARVQNNVITGNLAWDFSGFGSGGMGGGILCDVNINATGDTLLLNNTIVDNAAPATFLGHQGGGLAIILHSNRLLLANNLIAFNSSGLWRYPFLTFQPRLQNNLLHNPNANYLNLDAGSEDIAADPQFVGRETGDYRLLPTSPGIDAGTAAHAPTRDFDGVARPLDGNADGLARWDIGAFEFVHPETDTDRDGMLDAAELIAGTDPTDPTSFLRLHVQQLAFEPGVTLRWPSASGRSYIVEYRLGLDTTTPWQTILDGLPGSGEPIEWLDPTGSSTSRFYRLGVSLP